MSEIIYYVSRKNRPFAFTISDTPPENPVAGKKWQVRKGIVVGTLKELYARYVSYDLSSPEMAIIYEKMRVLPEFQQAEDEILADYYKIKLVWSNQMESGTVRDVIKRFRQEKSADLRKVLKRNKIPVLI